MNISNLLESIAVMLNMPIPLLVLIPVSLALAFQILRAAEGNKIEERALSVKDWDGDKNSNEKPSSIAMLSSLIFIVFSTFTMYNATNDKPLFSISVIVDQFIH